jgi:beta-lactamase superfamily II metal-dependent hydrolase
VEAAKTWIDEHWHFETLSNNPEPTSASNETSIVQHAIIESGSILLTADAGPEALKEAADFASAMGRLKPPNFVQVPHHGSRRNVTPAVLDRWLGLRMNEGAVYGTAFCSVGRDQSDYPRGQVNNAFQRRGYPVHATRGQTKTFYFGRELRAGWSQSVPEPFATKVDT